MQAACALGMWKLWPPSLLISDLIQDRWVQGSHHFGRGSQIFLRTSPNVSSSTLVEFQPRILIHYVFYRFVGKINLDDIYKASVQFLVHNEYLASYSVPSRCS